MPYVSENTKNGPEFRLHDTATEAVVYLLNAIGPDYEGKSWPTWNNEEITQSSDMTDFTVTIHPDIKAAAAAQMDLDLDAIPTALRALADAVEVYAVAQAVGE